jgi:thiamine-monophosphate kinase
METAFIQWLRSQVPPDPRVPLGIGDDAAVLDLPPGRQWVVTTDMIMDGVDFVLGRHAPALVGRKSLAVNLSDLAAMGAFPVACFVSLALPRDGGGELARGIYEGIFELARQFDTALAGGDTNSWDGKLVISVTAVGHVAAGKAWRRSGARPGDQILVTGDFGGSILGKHFDFTPRVAAGMWLADHADVRAAIDVSDGMSLDLSRICQESGCGAVIDPAAIPVAAAATELASRGDDKTTALAHALGDGEDFELILALAPAEADRLLRLQPLDVPLTRIGQFVEKTGLWTLAKGGRQVPLVPRGYEHRFDA